MGDFKWTSYSTVYMLIKNEVIFRFSNNNLAFIIVTSPSLQPQFALDHTKSTRHKHNLPPNIVWKGR